MLQSHLYIVYMKELFSAELDRYPEEVLKLSERSLSELTSYDPQWVEALSVEGMSQLEEVNKVQSSFEHSYKVFLSSFKLERVVGCIKSSTEAFSPYFPSRKPSISCIGEDQQMIDNYLPWRFWKTNISKRLTIYQQNFHVLL